MEFEKDYQMAMDRVSKLEDRRQTVTTTYLSVNTLISGAIAFLAKDAGLSGTVEKAAVAAFLLGGIVATIFWRAILDQLSLLIGHWYGVIRDLEAKMPERAALITGEYDDLYAIGSSLRPLGLSRYERGLSWLFTAIYAVFLIVGVWMLLTVQP